MTEDRVAAYLLGEQGLRGDVRGLIARVTERVRGYDDPQGPSFQTGSIMGTGSHRPTSSSESTEVLFELACDLICWMADSRGTPQAKTNLWRVLRRDDITDVDYLLGWERGPVSVQGKLAEVREKVRELTKVEPLPLKSQERLASLRDIFVAFMGECDHQFREEPGSDTALKVFECALCQARYATYGGSLEWFAV